MGELSYGYSGAQTPAKNGYNAKGVKLTFLARGRVITIMFIIIVIIVILSGSPTPMIGSCTKASK